MEACSKIKRKSANFFASFGKTRLQRVHVACCRSRFMHGESCTVSHSQGTTLLHVSMAYNSIITSHFFENMFCLCVAQVRVVLFYPNKPGYSLPNSNNVHFCKTRQPKKQKCKNATGQKQKRRLFRCFMTCPRNPPKRLSVKCSLRQLSIVETRNLKRNKIPKLQSWIIPLVQCFSMQNARQNSRANAIRNRLHVLFRHAARDALVVAAG